MNPEQNACLAGEAYARVSNGDGKPVILIHGLPSSLDEWNDFFDDLSGAGFKPMAMDLLGHGRSHRPESAQCYTVEHFFAFFCQWMDSQKLAGPVTLVGHSFGGHLALRYAAEYPERVERLVLINPFLSFDQMTLVNRLVFRFPSFAAALYSRVPAFLIRCFVWLGSLENGRFLHSSLTKADFESMLLDYHRCSPRVVHIPLSVWDEAIPYPQIHMPVLLLWGVKDMTLKVSWFERVSRKIPNCQTARVAGGHYPHRSNYGEVKPVILDFLRRTTSSIEG